MSGDCVARIEKLENGYTVAIIDEAISKKNADPKNKGWQDPWKEYAFSTADEVKEFIGKHLDALKPPPDADTEYGEAFAQAASEDD